MFFVGCCDCYVVGYCMFFGFEVFECGDIVVGCVDGGVESVENVGYVVELNFGVE